MAQYIHGVITRSENLALRFLHTNGSRTVAHNVIEFSEAVQTVPMASLRHHLVNNDFSRWASEVLGDEEFARRLRKLERTARTGVAIDRGEILEHVTDHYALPPPHD